MAVSRGATSIRPTGAVPPDPPVAAQHDERTPAPYQSSVTAMPELQTIEEAQPNAMLAPPAVLLRRRWGTLGETAALGEDRHFAVVSAIEFVSTRPAVVLVNAPSFADPILTLPGAPEHQAIARVPARRRSFVAVVFACHHARTRAPGRGPREAQGYQRPEHKLAIRRSYAPSARRRGAASCAPCWHDLPSAAGPNQVGGV